MRQRRIEEREPWTKALKEAADRLAANPPAEDLLADAARRSKAYSAVDIGSDMTSEEVAFAVALENFKHKYHCPFPTSSAVLAVLKSLGYKLEPK